MARLKKTEQLTPLELEIMTVLWKTGSANVQTVQQNLPRELAYTTVQTMLNVLQNKGKVKRTLNNRAYFYRPVISRRRVIEQTVGDVIDRLFGGSTESFVIGLLETKHLTSDHIARLREMLAEQEEKGDGNF
jgi:predicted transcriptional regulator